MRVVDFSEVRRFPPKRDVETQYTSSGYVPSPHWRPFLLGSTSRQWMDSGPRGPSGVLHSDPSLVVSRGSMGHPSLSRHAEQKYLANDVTTLK